MGAIFDHILECEEHYSGLKYCAIVLAIHIPIGCAQRNMKILCAQMRKLLLLASIAVMASAPIFGSTGKYYEDQPIRPKTTRSETTAAIFLAVRSGCANFRQRWRIFRQPAKNAAARNFCRPQVIRFPLAKRARADRRSFRTF